MIIIALLLGLQITLGVMNIYWHLPLANAVAHNVVAANLFVALILFIQQLHKRTNPLEVCHSISAVATPDPNS
jgi:cytochrome c oxidase assembly protein subunit 15